MSKINVKWLEYFKSNEDASESFVLKMSNFLVAEMESNFDTKIDWSQMWLYYPPNGKALNELLDQKSGKKFFQLSCSLESKVRSESYDGYLIWFDAVSNEIVKPCDNVENINLTFKWEGLSIRKDFLRYLPIKPPKKRIIFQNLNFKILTILSNMPHEGKFAITMEDINEKEKVSEILGYGLGKWNTQTDQARQTGDSALDKGYCHTVSLDGVEDNIAYWYIDAGSAHDAYTNFCSKS